MNNYTDIDYNKNEIRQASIWPLDTAPIGPVVGMTYFDTIIKSLRTWDGEKWVSAADLPIAGIGEEGALGGIRVGDRLSIDTTNGLLSADVQSDNNLTDELLEKIIGIDTSFEEHNADVGAHPYIQSLISAEAQTRQAQDNTISNNLSIETQRAMSAETNLQNTKEDKSNKTTSITSSSTNGQYPSAAAVYTELTKKVTANVTIPASNEYKVVKYDSKGLVTDGRKVTSDDVDNISASKIGNGLVSDTEYNYLAGLNANLQTQLDNLSSGKANKIGNKDLSDKPGQR